MRFIEKIKEAEKPQTKTIIVRTRFLLPLVILSVLEAAVIIYLLVK